MPEVPTRQHAAQWWREHVVGGSELHPEERLKHALSHLDYDIKPLSVRCAGKAAALRDDDRYRWYDA